MSVSYKDYYKILEVERTATTEEIDKSYKKLARKYHPDLNQGDSKAEEKFKEVNEAHEVLKDPQKRKIVRPTRTELERRAKLPRRSRL